MLYTPKSGDYLRIFTDEKVKDSVIINFGQYLKSTREKLYSKQNEEKNLGKVAESFYSFLTTSDKGKKYVELLKNTPQAKIMMQSRSSDDLVCHCNIAILNIFDSELQLINTC